MSFRVKDYWKNVVAEFDTSEELETYVSSSSTTSSLSGEELPLNYFQYDAGIHENLEVSGSFLTEESKNMVRITYIPGEDDIE